VFDYIQFSKSIYIVIYTDGLRILKRAHCQNIYISYTMRYTFPYILSHRLCSEDGCVIFLQSVDRFPLKHNSKYLDTTRCNHSTVSPDHEPCSHAPSTQSFLRASPWTASLHFSDPNVSYSLLFPSQNYVCVCCFHPICTSTISYNSWCLSSSYCNKCI